MKTKRAATEEDLMQMPKDGYKYELVDGEIVASPTGMYHSEVSVRIAYLLQRFVEDVPVGKVYTSDVGIRMPGGNIRSPDACFVTLEKLPGGQSPKTYGEVIPDLAVEVLSPSDRPRQVADKIGEYLQWGVPLVWLVDPDKKTVTVFRSLTEVVKLTEEDVITAEPMLPGFACPVARFF